jgi:RNA polymerase sigma-70 factor, ECF subfamily
MGVLEMAETDDATLELLRRAADGDQEALTEALSLHRDRLKRMVRLRLNQRLRGRIDESDVVQDVLLDASNRLDQYVANPDVPFFLWLRHIAGRKLIDMHRRHLGADKRDAALEISLHTGPYPAASSASLAAQLLGRLTSPSQGAMKGELRSRVQEALNALDPLDREVLALRHYEQLSNVEVAAELGIGKSTASSRYLRALKKIKDILAEGPGLFPD